MIDTPAKQAVPEPPQTQSEDTRKVWWIVGGTLTGAVLLMAMTWTGVWIWAVSSPEEHVTHSQEYTQPVAEVEVDTEIGEIVLNHTGGSALNVQRDLTWRGMEPEHAESWSGATFSATGACDDDALVGINADRCEVDYTLIIPSGVDAEAYNDIGDITVNGLDGALDLQTSVGDIEADNLKTTDTTVESSVGDVSLSFDEVYGDIVVTSSTGDIEIAVPDDGTVYDVRFDAGVGERSIDIATDPAIESDYTIWVTTSVGDVSVHYTD